MSSPWLLQGLSEYMPFAPLAPFITTIYELCISTAFFWSRTDALKYK